MAETAKPAATPPSAVASPDAPARLSAGVGVFRLGPGGQVEEANPAGQALLAGDDGRLRAALADPELLAAARVGVPAAAWLALPSGGNGEHDEAALSLVRDAAGGLVGVVTPNGGEHLGRAAGEPMRRWLDEAPGMVGYLDPAGCWLTANRELRRWIGLTAAELRGRELLLQVHPSDRARLAELLHQARDGRIHRLELRLAHGHHDPDVLFAGDDTAAPDADGRLEAELTLSATSSGAPAALCLLLQDISRRKTAEREREAYVHELESLYLRLEEANQATRQAEVQSIRNEELAQLEQVKSACLNVAAHELRTPVTLIRGILDYLGDDRVPSDLANTLRETAIRNTQRLASIIESSLKLLEGDPPVAGGGYRRGDLLHVLRASVEDVGPFLELRRQELAVDLPESLPEIDMDASQLRDVAVNLLGNAIKFTPDGGRLALYARRHGDEHVQFAVRDEGIGISQDDLPHIFERFFGTIDTRHHSSGSYEFQARGPGFGLALVRKFVALHGGKVEVTSELGEGSTFTVILPVRHSVEG